MNIPQPNSQLNYVQNDMNYNEDNDSATNNSNSAAESYGGSSSHTSTSNESGSYYNRQFAKNNMPDSYNHHSNI